MATLTCSSSTENSLTFRLSGITSGVDYGHDRTFYFTCNGETKSYTVYATSTATSVSRSFSGLEPGTTYTCECEFTEPGGTGQTYTWEADGTTDEPASKVIIKTNDDWVAVRPCICINRQWHDVDPDIFSGGWK